MPRGPEVHYTDHKSKRRQQRRPLASMMSAITRTMTTATRRRPSPSTPDLFSNSSISKLHSANNNNKHDDNDRRTLPFRERRQTYLGVYRSSLLKYDDEGNSIRPQIFVRRVTVHVLGVLAAAAILFSAIPRRLFHPREEAHPSRGESENTYDVGRMLLRGSGDADAVFVVDSRADAPAGYFPPAARSGTITRDDDNHDEDTSESSVDVMQDKAKFEHVQSPEALARCLRRRKSAARLSTKASYKRGREKCAAILPGAVVDRRGAWLVNMHVDRVPTARAPGAIGGTCRSLSLKTLTVQYNTEGHVRVCALCSKHT